jgi:hypothetical protein
MIQAAGFPDPEGRPHGLLHNEEDFIRSAGPVSGDVGSVTEHFG